MALTRDDMLRELELLPVWRARVAAPAGSDSMRPEHSAEPSATEDGQASPSMAGEAEAALPVAASWTAAGETLPLATASVESSQREPAQTHAAVASAGGAFDIPSPLSARAEVPAFTGHFEEPATEAPLIDLVASEPELPADAMAVPVLQSEWFMYCPLAGDAQAQSLLQNIMRAMALPPEEVLLQLQPLPPVQLQVRYAVLFGLQAANTVLAASYEKLSDIRGQVITRDGMVLVVTHDVQAMLSTPMLKKEVWQDVCQLLAKKTVAHA